MKAKDNLLNKLKSAQQVEIAEKLASKQYTDFKCNILLLVLNKQEILLSFICGFIANLPISVLFNILTLDITKYNSLCMKIAYLIVYGLCLLSTIFLTVVSFQFTIKYARINNQNNNLPNTITHCLMKDNESKKKNKTPLSYLACKGTWFIVFAICTIVTVIALCVMNFWGNQIC